MNVVNFVLSVNQEIKKYTIALRVNQFGNINIVSARIRLTS